MRLDAQGDARRPLHQHRPARCRGGAGGLAPPADAFDVADTNRLARTLRAWEPELLAYLDDRRLTNDPTEGTNRIIKAVKRQRLRHTNTENHRRRVLYRCA